MSQRDEIAAIVYDVTMGYANEASQLVPDGACLEIADRLLAAGLLVPIAEEDSKAAVKELTALLKRGNVLPPGLTAEKLRAIAAAVDNLCGSDFAPAAFDADDLRVWASFLDTQETPT